MADAIEKSSSTAFTEEDILRRVASAVLAIDGVAGLSSNLNVNVNIPMIGNKIRGVRMSENGRNTEFDIYVDVEYGVRIPQLAWDIQREATSLLESEFGITATVNIHVQNVISNKEKEQ